MHTADTDLYGLVDLHTAIRPWLFHSLEHRRRLCGDVLGGNANNVSLSMTTFLWSTRRGLITPEINAQGCVRMQAYAAPALIPSITEPDSSCSCQLV